MRPGWRPTVVAAVASTLLAGCGAELSSSCSASMTTSPDWVFGLLLESGLVAILSSAVWVGFLPGLVKSPSHPEPKRWWSPGGPVQVPLMMAFVAYTEYNSRDLWVKTPDLYIHSTFLVFFALIAGGIVAAGRRHRATGMWPSGRQAPWGLFWVLPVIFVAAASSTLWAFATMASSSVPVPC